MKLSFKKLRDKRGSIFIEASFVLPLMCIVLITMITTAMSFYGYLANQVQNHKNELGKENYSVQMAIIRNYEKDI